ncbi:TraR/DksA C4-type zinc finger protein [Thiopseudomonas denitrificans]|uniref:TraR/DksA family transcriptional regulator n=1 Tax=Thiopseudomonas denitrificans TaxID=1501432 RepID=A0A4R6TU76_9GAMM|nr:TraR/DksA C4-type zinc finger protein [Thiopseudomonas denitrificans]TDQ37260.1 TraR/DksA family transcriptional regulator [Thiopseudomonas denitrificans]
MAKGWGSEDAAAGQMQDTLDDAVRRVRDLLPCGESARDCDECGEPIAEGRRQALPGVRLCIACQQARDSGQA